MSTRTNRADEFLWFGCCKNEKYVGWWFLHDFKERVGGAGSKLVRFVDDVNLVT